MRYRVTIVATATDTDTAVPAYGDAWALALDIIADLERSRTLSKAEGRAEGLKVEVRKVQQ